MSLDLRDPADLRRVMGVAFSAEQIDAITAPLRPGLIVAGAGTGKTTVMAARVVWLVGRGLLSPDEILGLTFTNKAAAELGQRIRASLDRAGLRRRDVPAGADEGGEGEPFTSTYHAYAARLLAAHGLWIGHEPDTRLIADATRYQVALQVIRTHRDPIVALSSDTRTLVEYLLKLDAQLCDHLVSPDDVRQWQTTEGRRWRAVPPAANVAKLLETFDARAELLSLVEEYRAVKAARGIMDFSDQMSRAALLTEAHPAVGTEERSHYRVVLLDEYQDTSVAQARMLRSLFSGADPRRGLGHPVTAVGDPFQAIYGWRGASASNITGFAGDFPAADGPVVTYPLSINRRSAPAILEIANDQIGRLRAETPGSEPLQAPAGAPSGRVTGGVYETYEDELADLAGRVHDAHDARAGSRWSDIAVLIRDNKTAAAVHAELVEAGIPVEVVGLSGLLAMPEVADVVAVLKLTYDVTANADLLHLLAGPRWAIGPRDLALLGTRARDLARGFDPRPVVVDGTEISADLAEAVAGVDPTDVVSLLEALEQPGSPDRYPYSADARERFALLGDELRMLRRYAGEPLLDLVRRVIEVSGIDVELAASGSRAAASRRDNLSGFIEAVATFAGTDQDASLPGLLAYLDAEEEYGNGLPLALPSASDSVKLMTIFRAKGLEWDTVFLPSWCKGTFPPAKGRSRWTTVSAELPWPLRGDRAALPALAECSKRGIDAFVDAVREYDVAEERRLAYVAVTRPRRDIDVSAHFWGPTQKLLRGPSPFMATYLESLRRVGGTLVETAAEPEARSNPRLAERTRHPWPVDADADEVARRRSARALVVDADRAGWQHAAERADDDLTLDELATVQDWDRDIDRLLEEARSATDVVDVALPSTLSATAVERLRDQPERFARDLARPMPRRPVPAARFGTRFHAWVEAYLGRPGLLEPDDLPGGADEIAGEDDLRQLTEAFRDGPFGTRLPVAVEAPFNLVLADQLVRGRIDAVYRHDGGYLVVDWKTSQDATADPLQLAVYRLAWAELTGVPVESVQAAFYYVRTGDVVAPDDLPGRGELERVVVERTAGPPSGNRRPG